MAREVKIYINNSETMELIALALEFDKNFSYMRKSIGEKITLEEFEEWLGLYKQKVIKQGRDFLDEMKDM